MILWRITASCSQGVWRRPQTGTLAGLLFATLGLGFCVDCWAQPPYSGPCIGLTVQIPRAVDVRLSAGRPTPEPGASVVVGWISVSHLD